MGIRSRTLNGKAGRGIGGSRLACFGELFLRWLAQTTPDLRIHNHTLRLTSCGLRCRCLQISVSESLAYCMIVHEFTYDSERTIS
jgi:hypothetical protein